MRIEITEDLMRKVEEIAEASSMSSQALVDRVLNNLYAFWQEKEAATAPNWSEEVDCFFRIMSAES